ncbi:MAG: hypothetical protein PVI06_06535 [Desulfobacterales bacterium]
MISIKEFHRNAGAVGCQKEVSVENIGAEIRHIAARLVIRAHDDFWGCDFK